MSTPAESAPTAAPARQPKSAPDTAASRFVIGIDAGGTRTTALLARAQDGAILGRGTGGPGNIRAAGAEQVTISLAAAVKNAFASAGLSPRSLAAAAIGAAGAARPDDRAAVEGCLRAVVAAEHYAVTNDGAIALRADVPDGPGVLLIAGTGSIGYGRAMDGREVRTGGWGYLLDDAGSAYSVGLAGLAAVLRAHDGRGEATILGDSLLADWSLAAPDEIIGRVYRQPTPRDEIAALAPLVANTARAGDPVAAAIVTEAGAALGALAVATLRKLGTPPDHVVPLVTAGGFLRACDDLLTPALLDAVRSVGFSVEKRPAANEAAVGAIELARSLLGDAMTG